MPGSWGERNRRNGARNRDSWQKLLKKALAERGCCANDDDSQNKPRVYFLQIKTSVVFTTGTECVYSAVRTGTLSTIQVRLIPSSISNEADTFLCFLTISL